MIHHMLKGGYISNTLPCVCPLVTVCRDGQPPQSRSDRRGWLCVGFAAVFKFRIPETLNNTILLTAVLGILWPYLTGIYL
jgi:hypothetical protein